MVAAQLQIAILAAAVYYVAAAARTQENGEHVTPEIVHSDNRNPAQSLPEVIHYKIMVNGSFRVLNLKRRCVGLKRIEIYLPGGQEGLSKAAFPSGSGDDVAHYHDIQNMAAVSLRFKPGRGHHDMEGTFQSKGSLYSIRPKRNGQNPVSNAGGVSTHIITNLDHKHTGDIDQIHYPPQHLYKWAAAHPISSPQYQPNNRQRRATPPSYEIDLCYATDYSFYTTTFNYLLLSNSLITVSDVLSEIRYYLSNVENLVALRYTAINITDWTITTKLAALYIETSPTGSAWLDVSATSDGPTSQKVLNGVTALNLFGTWLSTQTTLKFPNFDHYALFTGYNLYGLDSTGARGYGVVGMAWVGTACTAYGLSVIEFMNDLTEGLVQAHELGHSLNASHDGTDNTCLVSDQYIMAPSVPPSSATNFYTFSPCTISYFRNFISYLVSNLANCFTNVLPTYNATQWSLALSLPPGQHYTAKDQCQRIFGVGFLPCGGVQYGSQVCSALWCYNTSQTSLTCYNSGTNVRALDGTTCGNKKWCYSGQCVSNSSAPSGSDICPLGDLSAQYPVFSNLPYNCSSLPSMYCYNQAAYNTCCQTCGNLYNASWPACPYGDSQNCAGLWPYNCYNAPWSTKCCNYCRNHQLTIANCTYGDYYTNCASLGTAACRFYPSQCCATCAALKG